MCYLTIYAIPVKCYLAFVFFSKEQLKCVRTICANYLRILKARFWCILELTWRLSEQCLLAFIHLLPMAFSTSARKKDQVLPFAFVSHCSLLVDFSGFFFTRNDRGMLIVSSGSRLKQNILTIELKDEFKLGACNHLNYTTPLYQKLSCRRVTSQIISFGSVQYCVVIAQSLPGKLS